jgi:DNA-directed RNA polymerase specialized sigma subunit
MDGPLLKARLQKAYESLNARERCVFEYYFVRSGYTEEEIGTLCWPEKPVTDNRVCQVIRKIKFKFKKALINNEKEGEDGQSRKRQSCNKNTKE